MENDRSNRSEEAFETVISSRLEVCSNYSFKVPVFPLDQTKIDGEGFKRLIDDVISLLKSHLDKSVVLLENQDMLQEEVAESVRVAVGRTELLLRKRMSQFTKQLHSHLVPSDDEKMTTINDLIGLWSLVDMQLEDIRACFEQVEKYRLSGWQDPKKMADGNKEYLI